VVIAGFFLGVTPQDWRWLVLGIALVWGAEAMNTAVEMACDAISQDHHPLIGKAKDAAAGAVLVAAIAAVIIGALVFWPYVF
jgi:diacylglycerol kinase (ATP)